MKSEKFFTSLFMLNIILIIAVVYSVKNDTMLSVFEEIFYSKKVNSGFMTFPPSILHDYGFRSDPDDVRKAGMDEIFSKTGIRHSDIDSLSTLPPFERAVMITKMFSSMGDGVCNESLSIADKITAAKKKSGCPKDFAEIFSALAQYSGLKTRIVKNEMSYAVEVFDGKKWFFIDPYFAMAAYNEDSHPLSYYQTADRLIHSGWIRFHFFGGENHCMYGKFPQDHPYYKNRTAFNSIYALMGDNIFSIAAKEASVPEKPKFVHIFAPYRQIKPYWVHVTVGEDSTVQLKKFVAGGLVIWVLLFIASNIVFPAYFIYTKTRRRRL